jgi:hypothetical protein
LADEKPYWSYEDIGVFSLVLAVLGPILHLFTRFHLLSRSELENPGLGLQFTLSVSLILVLYLVLKLRHRRPVFRPLGWVWPRTVYVIVAPLLGVLLAAGVALYLRSYGQSTPTMPLVEIVVLGLLLGPILEELFGLRLHHQSTKDDDLENVQRYPGRYPVELWPEPQLVRAALSLIIVIRGPIEWPWFLGRGKLAKIELALSNWEDTR